MASTLGERSTVTDAVRAEQVAYRYGGTSHLREALAPISLHVQPGKQLLVTGPSGCGKSTLARCLTGMIPHLYRGTLAGDVWLGGLHTAETPMWRLAEAAGLVFQNPAAQMLTVSVEEEIIFGLENLGLPRHDITARLEATLDRFGLGPLRKRAPQTLSGGEQQKLALAAITARRPPLLVLDEPLSMLDAGAVADLVAHLTELSRAGTAVVICEHRAEAVGALPGLRTHDLEGPTPSMPRQLVSGLNASDVALRLVVEDLRVRLGGRDVLRDLSFTAQGGQVLAVVGRNGVGKTTLLRALAGLQKHGGAVTINGGPPDLGMVFQNADLQLFNASIREEVLYRLPDPDMARYTWLLETLGLRRYETVPPLLLSEGEKKRVALATVLMRRPRHGVLLDEPALGQDNAHKAILTRLTHALAAAGQLVILTTHDLNLAARADRLLLLGPTGLVADGPPAQILREPAPWATLGLPVPDWIDLPALASGE